LWLLCPRAPRVAPPKLSHRLLCLHIGHSTWCLCFESCPCSFASHASMIFLQTKACCPPMLVLCMWLENYQFALSLIMSWFGWINLSRELS
jgi:hypothetical protein